VRPIVVLFLLAASLAAQTASVEGVVLNQSTGQPLSDVHVRVLTGDVATLSVERVYGAMSDRAGHFSISGMKPGLYLVVPERPGFVFVRQSGPVPATVLALKAGQHITDQRVEMTACGFVSGRVVDDNGDPIQGAYLRLQAAPPDTDFVNPFAVPLQNYTDDRGEFRMVVSPGKYYLQAVPLNYRAMMDIRGGAVTATPYVATYYPNTQSMGEASAIQVKPGQEVASLEIRLAHARLPVPGGGAMGTLSIGGMATGMPDGARATVSLLRAIQNAGAMQMFRGGMVDPQGKFLVGGLPPGSYKVFAQYSAGKVRLQSEMVEVQLTGADVSNLQLRLAPGEDLGGSLEFAGEAPGAAPPHKIAVKLESVESGGPAAGETSPAEMGKDGSFRIPTVFPGRYRLRVEPLPEGTFIRSVTLDRAAVDEAGFALSRGGGSRLKIILSRNAGQVSGKVLDHDGAPLTSPLAAVLVWNDAAQVRPEHNPVADSRYVLKNLRPGKYRLLAVDAFDFTNLAGANDPDEFAKALLAAAEEIEVGEGARMAKDLKVVAKEDIHVQPKH